MFTRHIRFRHARAAAILLSATLIAGGAMSRELMLVGDDEKTTWDDAGEPVTRAPGKDLVLVVDIADRLAPVIVARLPLMNTIFGPPTNLQITPDGKLALVANSMDWVADGDGWKPSPDKIAGNSVKLIDTVPMGEQVAHVAIAPDGKHALAAKFPGNKIALLEIDGDKVTFNKQDIPVGLWPYNVDVTPDGKLALTADNGFNGYADGNVDTISVIDIESTPPRVIDKLVVDEAPEGLAISPDGKFAVAALLHGSNADRNAFFYHRNGSVALLKIDGKKVTRVQDLDVRGLPEGVVWSDDGQ